MGEPQPFIERYAGEQVPHPAVAEMGRSHQQRARRGLRPHSRQVYGFYLIQHGTVEWFIEDQIYRLPPGSVFIPQPGQRYGAVGHAVEPCTMAFVQVHHDRPPADEVAAELPGLPGHVLPEENVLWTLHDGMLAECRRPGSDSERVVDGLLRLFLAWVIRMGRRKTARQAAAASAAPGQPPPLQRALEAIEAEPARWWDIGAIRASAGVSRTRLFQLFQKHLGQSPATYVRAMRLRLARQRLVETDKPITEIAHELGFSSSQHFTTTFRQHYGARPAQFRRAPSR